MKVVSLCHHEFKNFPRAEKQIETLSNIEHVTLRAISPVFDNPPPEATTIGNAKATYHAPPVSFPDIHLLKIINVVLAMWVLFTNARKERADIYHCVGIYALLIGITLQALQSDTKIIYDAPEDYSLQIQIAYPGLFGDALSRGLQYVEAFAVRRVDVIFTVNSSNGRPADRLRRHNENTVVLENVPKLEEFDTNQIDNNPLAEYEDRSVLVYVGGISRQKGGDMMLDVMDIVRESHPEAYLLIIGGGTDRYMNHLQDRIDELELYEHVELKGVVPYKRVPAYLSNADIGFQVYQHGPWNTISMASSTVFRHMGFGLPMVVTDLPGMGKQISNFKCGLTADVEDPEAIAEAVSRVLSDDELAEKLGARGRELVETRYNWGEEKQKFLEHVPIEGRRGTVPPGPSDS